MIIPRAIDSWQTNAMGYVWNQNIISLLNSTNDENQLVISNLLISEKKSLRKHTYSNMFKKFHHQKLKVFR